MGVPRDCGTQEDIPGWLEAVLKREDRKTRSEALRRELAEARLAGKRRRHEERLRRIRAAVPIYPPVDRGKVAKTPEQVAEQNRRSDACLPGMSDIT